MGVSYDGLMKDGHSLLGGGGQNQTALKLRSTGVHVSIMQGVGQH